LKTLVAKTAAAGVLGGELGYCGGDMVEDLEEVYDDRGDGDRRGVGEV
jgi:hypothetical protein